MSLVRSAVERYFSEGDIEVPEKIGNIYRMAAEHFGEENVMLLNGIPDNESREACITRVTERIRGLAEFRRFFLSTGNFSYEDFARAMDDSPYTPELCRRWNLIIHWKHIKVENEFGNYTYVDDLFGRLGLSNSYKCLSYLWFLRTTYSEVHFLSKYVHSHLYGLGTGFDSIKKWRDMCLGTSILTNFIRQMSREEEWPLYFEYIDKAVRTESIEGSPYMLIEEIGSYRNDDAESAFKPSKSLIRADRYHQPLKEFLHEYLNSDAFKVGFYNNGFNLGVPFMEWYCDISRRAIQFSESHENCLEPLFETYGIKDGKIMESTSNESEMAQSAARFNGRHILTFNGKDYKLKILSGGIVHHTKLLEVNTARKLLYVMLSQLNYTFERIPKDYDRTEKEKPFRFATGRLYGEVLTPQIFNYQFCKRSIIV